MLQGGSLHPDNLPHGETIGVLGFEEEAGRTVPAVLLQGTVVLFPSVQLVLTHHAAHGVRGGLATRVVEPSLRHLQQNTQDPNILCQRYPKRQQVTYGVEIAAVPLPSEERTAPSQMASGSLRKSLAFPSLNREHDIDGDR